MGALRKTLKEHAQRVIANHQHFIFDCDGVIWNGNVPVPGSVKALEKLRSLNKKISFLTNSASKSRRGYLEKFISLGIQASENEIISSAYSAARYLSEEEKATNVLCIGSKGLMEELRLTSIPKVTHASELEFAKTCPTHRGFVDLELEKFSHVVMGMDVEFSYARLCIASLAIQQGAKLVATNLDLGDNVGGAANRKVIPGTGCLVRSLELSTGVTAINAGKPTEIMYRSLFKSSSDNEANKMIMIGDRLDTDIRFGNNFNMSTMLVLTGISQMMDVNELDNKHTPTYFFDSIGDCFN